MWSNPNIRPFVDSAAHLFVALLLLNIFGIAPTYFSVLPALLKQYQNNWNDFPTHNVVLSVLFCIFSISILKANDACVIFDLVLRDILSLGILSLHVCALGGVSNLHY